MANLPYYPRIDSDQESGRIWPVIRPESGQIRQDPARSGRIRQETAGIRPDPAGFRPEFQNFLMLNLIRNWSINSASELHSQLNNKFNLKTT